MTIAREASRATRDPRPMRRLPARRSYLASCGQAKPPPSRWPVLGWKRRASLPAGRHPAPPFKPGGLGCRPIQRCGFAAGPPGRPHASADPIGRGLIMMEHDSRAGYSGQCGPMHSPPTVVSGLRPSDIEFIESAPGSPPSTPRGQRSEPPHV